MKDDAPDLGFDASMYAVRLATWRVYQELDFERYALLMIMLDSDGDEPGRVDC